MDSAPSQARQKPGEAAAREFVPFPEADVETSIPLRFQQQAVRHADRVAVKTRTRRLTYRELEWEANRLAQTIVERRGSEQEPIAYFVADDAKIVIAMLGILKAGKIFVPLNVEYPTSRNRLIVKDSQASMVIVEGRTANSARETTESGALLNLDAIDAPGREAPAGVILSGGSFASIVYTSGSTGQPKGVLQTHRNQLHNTMHHTNTLRITPNDRFCLLSSRATQQALVGIFSAVLNGAGLYPFRIKEEGLERLENWIEEEGITIYHSSASIFRQFAKSLANGRRLDEVRVVKLGSEPVGHSDFALWKEHFAGVFVNALSSTETGTIRQFVADQDTMVQGNRMPAGFAVRDMEVLLLDEMGVPETKCEVGEIAVRSKYIFSQYWRRPDDTGRAFVDQPDAEGRRTFRTGDLGRLASDGCLLHQGRKDSQVKIRGNRVEPAEIELALLEIANVRQGVATAFEKTPGNPILVAYIVPEQEPAPKPAFIRAELRKRLPDHMVPGYYVFMLELPLTPSGKVNRAALPLPTREGQAQAPVSSVELQVTEIWKEILGVETIDIRQDFFESGGDSLLAIRLLDELEETFGKNLTPEVFLDGGTIQSLSEKLIGEWNEEPPALLLSGSDSTLQPPLFFLHGDYSAGGLYAIRLAKLLDRGLALYALQPLRKQGKPLPVSIEAMAKENLEKLKAAQAHGPYRLSGYCNGGLVALEMAQRLIASGETVELVVAIDSIARNTDLRFFHRLTSTFSTVFRLTEEERINLFLRVKQFVERVRAQKKTKRLSFVAAKLWYAAARRLHWSRGYREQKESQAAAVGMHSQSRNQATEEELSDEKRHAHFQRLVRSYLPRPYDGKIVLLASEDRLRECQEPALGWENVSKHLTVRSLPGNHQTCITKHLPELAEELKRCLGPYAPSLPWQETAKTVTGQLGAGTRCNLLKKGRGSKTGETREF